MKTLSKICAVFLLVASPSIAFADDCTGTMDVSDLDVGCDQESSRVVSIGKCDFRPDKSPNVTITNVIDGRGSALDAVVVGDAVAGNFNVTIRPKPRTDVWSSVVYCKVENFNWLAE